MKFIIVLFVIILASSSGFAQPVQWTAESGGNGHWYEIVHGYITWENAFVDASSRLWEGQAGHLVAITSSAEDSWVWTILHPDMCWMGGFQPIGSPEPDGGWTWVTGETWSYTNWAVGEPNDAHDGTEHSLIYHDTEDGTWNDRANLDGRPLGYVVEYEEVIVAVPNCSLGGIKAIFR